VLYSPLKHQIPGEKKKLINHLFDQCLSLGLQFGGNVGEVVRANVDNDQLRLDLGDLVERPERNQLLNAHSWLPLVGHSDELLVQVEVGPAQPVRVHLET
jgi:hypothetical protein